MCIHFTDNYYFKSCCNQCFLGWMRWRLCPRGRMKTRMGDLFQTLPGFNFQLRRSCLEIKIPNKLKFIQVQKAKFSIQISLNGAYLMDCGDKMLLFIGKVVSSFFCEKVTSSCSRWIDLEIIFLAADVWRLAAELRRRELDGPARAGKRGQRETAQFCGLFHIFKDATFV